MEERHTILTEICTVFTFHALWVCYTRSIFYPFISSNCLWIYIVIRRTHIGKLIKISMVLCLKLKFILWYSNSHRQLVFWWKSQYLTSFQGIICSRKILLKKIHIETNSVYWRIPRYYAKGSLVSDETYTDLWWDINTDATAPSVGAKSMSVVSVNFSKFNVLWRQEENLTQVTNVPSHVFALHTLRTSIYRELIVGHSFQTWFVCSEMSSSHLLEFLVKFGEVKLKFYHGYVKLNFSELNNPFPLCN